MRGNWFRTFSGKLFYPLDPRAEEICIEDIAHALSLQCRFTGHVSHFYSVAQHSVIVSHLCDPADALWGLLHDAPEAYIGDMSSPLKHTPEMSLFRDTEKLITEKVCERFNLTPNEPASVKAADKRLVLKEAANFGLDITGWDTESLPLPGDPICGWPPEFAEIAFLERYRALTGGSRRVAVPQADGYVDEEMDVHGH